MSRKEYEDLDGPIGKRDQGYTATQLLNKQNINHYLQKT